MLFVIAFDFHVSERFKHFVERWKIFAIARFVSCREYDVSDCLGQLDVGDALPLRIRLGGWIFVDEIRLPVARFPRVEFLFRFAVHFFHLLDCHGDKLSNVLVICACDLGVHDRVRFGPGRSFWIENAWQSLLGSGAVIENPPCRRIDLERSLGAVNDSTRKRLLGEKAAASYKQGEAKKGNSFQNRRTV